jgi:hypothetical protein
MQYCTTVSTPMDIGTLLKLFTISNMIKSLILYLSKKYQSVIGSLMYIALGTRPDIALAVGLLSKFASRPQKKHQYAV